MKKLTLILTCTLATILFSCKNDGKEGVFTDPRDGKTYKTVRINRQTWMAENLAYLPSVSPPEKGAKFIPYYYVYGYKGRDTAEAKATENYKTYGVLYNWSAAMNKAKSSNTKPSGVQGACPDGWHLPSSIEWDELIDYLTYWKEPNRAENLGFNLLFGGYLGCYGNFHSIKNKTVWWSSTEWLPHQISHAISMFSYQKVFIEHQYYTKSGVSIRCIKNK